MFRARDRASSVAHVAWVNLCDPAVALRVSAPGEGHRTVRRWAREVHAALAINGDFFMPGFVPVGPARGNGSDWPAHPREYFGAVLAAGPGAPPAILRSVPPNPPYTDFISSMDPIVVAGRPVVDPNVIYGSGRHPRTAVGFTRDLRTMAFVVVDGRSSSSAGVTMPEFRELLLGLGLFEALNMDGGGSSTLVLGRRGVVNHPSDGFERAVANHVGVVLRDPPAAGAQRAQCSPVPTLTPRGDRP